MPSVWNRLIHPAQRRFRRARARRIRDALPQIEGGTVIDIGGALTFWSEVEDILNPRRVVCYNISKGRMEMGLDPEDSHIVTRLYDGVRIPEDDGSADVVLCNSVLEHVPVEARANLAAEIRRVGKRYAVQTPSPAFPLELHFGLPFVHWLPRRLGRALVHLSPFHLLSGSDGPAYFDETRLLRKAELEGLFPHGCLVTERLLAIPKSYLVFG